ncbi:hypothetical protein ES705_42378 [subsurface metagenome]
MKRKLFLVGLVLVIIVAGLLTGCWSGNDLVGLKVDNVDSILGLSVGDTYQLQIAAIYENNYSIDVTTYCYFCSGDNHIVSVSDGGEVTAIKKGIATIFIDYEETGISAGTRLIVIVGLDD